MPDPTGSAGLISQIIDLFKGIKGDDLDAANGIADVADPFRQQRSKSQEMLFKLLSDPTSFTQDAGYQFAKDQGLDATARKGNAMFGTTRVGNTAVELDKFGTGFASQAYNDRIQQLMKMSGVDSGSPATAAAMLMQGRKDRDQSLGSGITGAGGILDAILGGGGIMGLFKGATGNIMDLFKGMFGPNGDLDLSKLNDLLAQAGLNGDYPGEGEGDIITSLFGGDGSGGDPDMLGYL